jgi:membrane protein implicated in regulation of membrane protease activity
MQARVKAVCGGIVAALLAFVPSFMLFKRILVACWEWHHGGRMKITFWADDRAFIIVLVVCAALFYLTARYLQRRLSKDQQIKRRPLLIGAASGVILIYFSVVTYVWIIVGGLLSHPSLTGR